MVWGVLSRKNAPANAAWPRPRYQALSPPHASGMGEDILGCETGQIEADPIRQEAKAGLRHLFTALAGEHGIEPCLERMQMHDIGGRVGDLRFAQFRRAPVR